MTSMGSLHFRRQTIHLIKNPFESKKLLEPVLANIVSVFSLHIVKTSTKLSESKKVNHSFLIARLAGKYIIQGEEAEICNLSESGESIISSRPSRVPGWLTDVERTKWDEIPLNSKKKSYFGIVFSCGI